MVLSPPETTPTILVRFTPKTPQKLIKCVEERLISGGILVVTSEGYSTSDIGADEDEKGKKNKNGCVVLGLSTTQDRLEKHAELLQLVRPAFSGAPSRSDVDDESVVMEHFNFASRDKFVNAASRKACAEDAMGEYDIDGIFTSADRACLLESMLKSLPVIDLSEKFNAARKNDDSKETTENSSESSNLARLFDELKVSYIAEDLKKSTKIRGSLLSCKNEEQESQQSDPEKATSLELIRVLQSSGFIDAICPAHTPHIRDKILKKTIWSVSLPIHAIRAYYGESIAFYFAFMHHLSRYLIFPGFMALTVYFLRIKRGDTVDNCDLTPFVGLATFIWSVVCVRLLERQESRLSYSWGTFATSDRDHLALHKRSNFIGTPRISPVTGQIEKYYPPHKRRIQYLVSAFITVLLLSGACIIMVVSMNLQGYISKEDSQKWMAKFDEEHPLYFAWFASLAEEGNIFDANSWYKSLIPVILRSIVVTQINNKYRGVAEKLSEWENHETWIDHDNSIILKRFLFEAFDAYIILFYLAIYERDIQKVRGELVGAFNVDMFRRLLLECILPFVMKKMSSGGREKNETHKKKKMDDDIDSANTDSNARLILESDLVEYEQFDDYIEMLIQFGYITLFASAYPLASFIAIGANLVEYRADLWKLSYLCRRPSPVRTDGIGMWKNILKVMIWTSALTNCLIFAFTSSQMRQWLPDNYTTDDFGNTVLVPGTAHETLLILVTIEHCLLLLNVLISAMIPRVPEDVVVKLERRQWLHECLFLRKFNE